MLLNYRGERRMVLDPKCRELAKDFEQLAWKSDPRRQPDHGAEQERPYEDHTSSDALGYYVEREFPGAIEARRDARADDCVSGPPLSGSGHSVL